MTEITKTPAPRNIMTEAEIAIRNALHELEVQKGNGIFNIPALRRILQEGLTVEPDRVVKRPIAQASELLNLDETGGH